jgi:transposase
MTGKRKRYSADFKAKVALEALRGELTTAQLATKHGIQARTNQRAFWYA